MKKDIFSRRPVNNMRTLISLTVLMLMFFCVSMGSAVVDVNNLQKSIDSYNSNIDTAPSVLRALLGDEKVNATILLNNSSTISWGFETKNAKIVRSEKGGIENPTIDVFATEDAIYRVENAADPVAAYRDAERSGEVSIKGNTLGAKLKLAAALSSGEAIRFFFGILS
jgi:hypothetical protein